jgi:hypothetical protein
LDISTGQGGQRDSQGGKYKYKYHRYDKYSAPVLQVNYFFYELHSPLTVKDPRRDYLKTRNVVPDAVKSLSNSSSEALGFAQDDSLKMVSSRQFA